MKKFISLFLALVMTLALMQTAFAYAEPNAKPTDPIVYIHGAFYGIVDEDGNSVTDPSYDTSALKDDLLSVAPELTLGFITGDFTEYNDKLAVILNRVYDRFQYDENGEPKYGTVPARNRTLNYSTERNKVEKDGTFGLEVYNFFYDYRQSPLKSADYLNEYINAVLEATGKEKVSIVGRCYGGAQMTAYLAKYGTDKVKAVIYDEATIFGGEVSADLFTGNINITPEGLTRFLDSYQAINMSDTLGQYYQVLSYALALMNSLEATGAITSTVKDVLWEKFAKSVGATFVRCSYGTFPTYWSAVSAQDYDTAINNVFGEEGSKYREQYKGLIEKLDAYHNEISVNLEDILLKAKENTNIYVIAKYGATPLPYFNNPDALTDSFVSLKNASFGATCAQIGETLSCAYLESTNSKYVSVDKMVDASTCLFPDSTWFLKGANHDDAYTYEEAIMLMAASNDEQVTVDTYEEFPQFAAKTGEDSFAVMTEENMNCEEYADVNLNDTTTMGRYERLITIIKNLIKFLISFFKTISSVME